MPSKHESIFKTTLRNMRRTLLVFEACVPAPQLVEFGPGEFHQRYVEQLPTQAIVMKLARVTTALHSSMILQAFGQLQDQGAIHRIVDEQNEDLSFLAHAVIKGEFTEKHKKFLKEFWQEEFEHPGTPRMRNLPRDRLPREQIRAYLANLPENGLNQSTAVQVTNMVGKTYSGYVHGAGSHIMEMYGGDPAHFHVEGMMGTPLWNDHLEDQVNYFHRSVNSFGLAAIALDRRALFEQIRSYRTEFEQALGMDYFDEIEKKHGRKKAKSR